MDAFREQIQTLTCKAGLLPPGCDVVKVSDIGALASAPPSAPVGPYTYASTQATTCAGCGEHKHTPLRIDAMGGYVCLTCIDQKLGGLLGEFGYPPSAPVVVEGHAAWAAVVTSELVRMGFTPEAAQLFASAEVAEYERGECDCAEMDPMDMVDLFMGTASHIVKKWEKESAGRMYGHKLEALAQQPAASLQEQAAARDCTVVENGRLHRLEQREAVALACEAGDLWYWQGDGADYPESLTCPVVMTADTLRELLMKAQQPAAPSVEAVAPKRGEPMTGAQAIALLDKIGAAVDSTSRRFTRESAAPQQPAAVDEAAAVLADLHPFLFGLKLAAPNEEKRAFIQERIDAVRRASAALAAQQQGGRDHG